MPNEEPNTEVVAELYLGADIGVKPGEVYEISGLPDGRNGIYTVVGADTRFLRYKPDQIMNMPVGRTLQVGDLPNKPREESVSGARQAAALMMAQFPLDPNRMPAKGYLKTRSHVKPNAAARRAARIAAGKLKVENGLIRQGA